MTAPYSLFSHILYHRVKCVSQSHAEQTRDAFVRNCLRGWLTTVCGSRLPASRAFISCFIDFFFGILFLSFRSFSLLAHTAKSSWALYAAHSGPIPICTVPTPPLPFKLHGSLFPPPLSHRRRCTTHAQTRAWMHTEPCIRVSTSSVASRKILSVTLSLRCSSPFRTCVSGCPATAHIIASVFRPPRLAGQIHGSCRIFHPYDSHWLGSRLPWIRARIQPPRSTRASVQEPLSRANTIKIFIY